MDTPTHPQGPEIKDRKPQRQPEPAAAANPLPTDTATDSPEQEPHRPWYRRLFTSKSISNGPATAQSFDEVADRQLRAMLADNEQRLWYICRFGKSDLDDASLKTLIRTRYKFVANPDCSLSEDEAAAYLQATMAASEVLGNAEPEAIRLYSQVQNRTRKNPLRYWLWAIGGFLILALGVNGYQTLIATQVKKMQDATGSYLDVIEGLTVDSPNIDRQLWAMCKHSNEFKLAAGQLSFLLNPFADRPADARATQVCTDVNTWLTTIAIRQPTERRPARPDDQGAAAPFPSVEQGATDGSGAQVFNVPIVAIVAQLRGTRFAEPGERELLPHAQAVLSILASVLLPMFYAALGALTSALRSANASLKAMTLTRIDNVNLFARVFLGVVGGATIGIVFKSDVPGTQGLTTLGLAFAVGYAVDIFFNVLDGVKGALGDSGQPPQAKR